jgi:hypothetical protein
MTPVRDSLFGVAAAAFFVSALVRAEAAVVNMKGDVRDHGAPVTLGHRVLPGTTLTTGAGAQVHLRFSDRQQIVLDQNTAFGITDFHYSADEPQGDRATFDLQRGAVRFISGAIGARNPDVVALRTPQATYSVRGTDFMVALVNPAYLKVLKGAVGVTNFAGTVVFGADSAAAVTSASAIAQPVFVARLPATASGAFSALAAVPTETAVMQADVSGAAGAATSAVPAPWIDVRSAIKLGIYAALIGAALSGGSSSATTHH